MNLDQMHADALLKLDADFQQARQRIDTLFATRRKPYQPAITVDLFDQHLADYTAQSTEHIEQEVYNSIRRSQKRSARARTRRNAINWRWGQK